jgi:FkbM family methyltransferase
MEIPKPAAERMMWALMESAKDFAEANPERFSKVALSHRNALQRIKKRGVSAATIIDLGAARGEWSKMARTVYTEAKAHLIEANHHWERELHQLSADPAYSYVIAAAGPSKGVGHFQFSPDPFGGAGTSPEDPKGVRVPQISVDSECAEKGLQAPFLLKFDTHGFEREILKGCTETLKSTSLIVIEAYNFGPREKRFPAMLELLEDMGFRCIDIGEPLFRDHDRSFWQMDFFLLPADRPEFQYGSFK